MIKNILAAALCILLCTSAYTAFAEDSERFVQGDLIVVLRDDAAVSASSAGAFRVASMAADSGARVVETYGALSERGAGTFALLHSDNLTTEELMRDIAARPDVTAAMPNYIVRAKDTTPNDLSRYLQWGMQTVNMPRAWDFSTGSDSVYVAVIDTGADYSHPDLAANLDTKFSRNFYASRGTPNPSAYNDENGHGTHVSGIIGAVGNNGIGVTGINWNVKIITLRTLGPAGTGYTSASLQAINYLLGIIRDNPDITLAAVNMSSGYYASNPPTPEYQNKTPLYLALKTLSDMDCTLIVAAAGNEKLEVGVPAPYSDPKGEFKKGDYEYTSSFTGIDNMISVAAFDSTMNFASYSNWSKSRVHIAAPGTSILSTSISRYSGAYRALDGSGSVLAVMKGTSMAAPHVSGAAALLKAAHPDWSASKIREALFSGANKNYFTDKTIYGVLDVAKAMMYSPAPEDDDPAETPMPTSGGDDPAESREPSESPSNTESPSPFNPFDPFDPFEPFLPSSGGGGCSGAALGMLGLIPFAFFRKR